MNVLLCHNYYQQPGGEDQVFADEAALLIGRGHSVERFTLHNDAIAQMSAAEVGGKTLWNWTIYRELRGRIRRFRPDVVHFTNTFPLISPAAYYAARAEGVPVVQSLHNFRLICPNAQLLRDGRPCEDCLGKLIAWPGIRHGCYRGSRTASAVAAGMLALHRGLRTWRRAVDAYIVLSEFQRGRLIEHGLPAERLHLKANFVDPVPPAGEGRGGYVAFVGRLSQEKGVRVLIDAWSQTPAAPRLKIAGDGPLAEQVRQAAAADSRIEWLGRQSSAEVLRTLSDAACLIVPSLWYEVCPKTILESLAVGTPVLASRLGAMPELVIEGQSGRHFTAGDAHDLARQLASLLADEPDLSAMRSQARRQFLDHYTAERNYERLMEIYRCVTHAATIEPHITHEPVPALIS